MHPFFVRRERLVIYLAAWLIIGLLLTALVALPGEVDWLLALVFALPLSLFYAFVCLSAWYLCRAFPFQKTDIQKLLLLYAIAASISSSIWILLAQGWTLLLSQLAIFETARARSVGEARLLFGIGVILYFLSVAVHYLITTFEASREAERRSLELKLHAQEAELKALRAQIDPHFLFNSLNSISALTLQNPEAARRMTLLLSDFLRKSLRFGAREQITLQEELSLIQHFFEIEQVRFGQRLQIRQLVDVPSANCLVPPLLLQPLVENAISHGIAHLIEGGTIFLSAGNRGSRLNIHIENPIDPDRPKSRGNGLGLDNSRKRLRTLYGSEARLETTLTESSFELDLSLPASVKTE